MENELTLNSRLWRLEQEIEHLKARQWLDPAIRTSRLIAGRLGRTATYVVAASDAPDHVKAQADEVCTGTDDYVKIQNKLTAAGKGVVRCEGTFNLGSTGLIFTHGVHDDLTLDFRGATFNYSGIGRAIDVKAHRIEILAGKIIATGDSITSATARGFYAETGYGRFTLPHIENFKVGAAVELGATTNLNQFPYIRIVNCKYGIYTTAEANSNQIGTMLFLVTDAALTGAIAIYASGASASLMSWDIGQLSANFYGPATGGTWLKLDNFHYPFYVRHLGGESDATSDFDALVLNMPAAATIQGVLIYDTMLLVAAGTGRALYTGNSVNLRHRGLSAGKNMFPIWEPKSTTNFTCYNATLAQVADGMIAASCLRLHTPTGGQIQLRAFPTTKVIRVASGDIQGIGAAIKSNQVGAVLRLVFYLEDNANGELTPTTAGFFKVPEADTWYKVFVATTAWGPLNALATYQGYLGIDIDYAADLEVRLGEFIMMGMETDRNTNSGTASITGAVNSVNVTHELAVTPTRVFVQSQQTGQGDYAVTAKGATNFTITFVTQPGGSTWYFDWKAQFGEG